MTAELIGWLAFALAASAAGFLFLRARTADALRLAQGVELEAASAELEAVHKRLDHAKAELRARGEELGELRKKHEKLRKRAGDSIEEEKALPAKFRALESELEAEKADARGARDEIVRLHAELEAAGLELSRERARVVEPPAAKNTDEVDGLRRWVGELEAKLGKLSTELEGARHDTAKYKGRWETLDKAYVVLRGELELKKDEARTQRVELERLRTLEVILTAPEEPETRT
jgi:predicted  nucleic acid-binding Zn-ribbon protein